MASTTKNWVSMLDISEKDEDKTEKNEENKKKDDN